MSDKSRILIVDDNPLNVNLLEAKLPSKDYEILHAYNGKEALEKADRELPDLILLDVMLPELDGYEVTKRLRNNPRTNDIPIILITALQDTEEKITGLESGADEFLNRPVDTAELQARVKSLIALKQYGEQLRLRIQSEQMFPTVTAPLQYQKEKTLLLVEDDEVAARLILSYLKDQPYHVEFLTDGVNAVRRIEQGQIDLILLDILLSGMDGFEICQHLKEMAHVQSIPIVMITCLKDTESKIRGIELGVDDFLVKPVHKEILIARINALLKKKEAIDRLAFDYERALRSAITDKLTGLYNYGYFKQFLQLEIERSIRQRHPLTLIMLDIDNFKQFNDTHGHLAGDEILRALAQLINRIIRKIDLAARYGGEEFAVILPYTTTKGALIVAERLRQAVESYPFMYKTSLLSATLTISIGIASFDSKIKTVEDLIERSDTALYMAKREGKNRVCVFDKL